MRSALAAALCLATLGGCGAAAQLDAAEAVSPAADPEVATLTTDELAALLEEGGAILIDVRTPEEFAAGRLPGALNAPVETFDAASIPKEEGRETILYCRSGNRSARAAAMLAEQTGGTVRHLEGGIVDWEERGQEVVVSPKG